MRIKYLIIVCVIFISLVTKGEAVHKFTIFFESNTFELSQNSKAKIDSVFKRISNTPKAYKVTILGYTDNIGNSSFNKNLSLKRASVTASYFTEKGFSKKKINYSGNGLSNPVSDNDTDKGKSKNRRVEITLSLDIPKIKSIAGIKPEFEKYKLKANEGGTIENPNGTKIIIPPAAFVDKKGVPVSGEVEIRYREEREPVDFMLGGVHMSYLHANSMHHFNSAGMFKILAYKNGEPIYLKTGEQIKMDFPLTQDLENLNFYRFDTVSNKWIEIAKLTGKLMPKNTADSLKSNSGQPMNCRNLPGGKRICDLDECGTLGLLGTQGVILSEKDDFIYSELKKEDSINTTNFSESWKDIVSKYNELKKESSRSAVNDNGVEKNVVSNKKKIAGNEIIQDLQDQKNDKSNRYYQLKAVKLKKNKSTFKIICKAKKLNEMESFTKVQWQYTSKTQPLSDSVFKVKWKYCQVIPSANPETYSIILVASGEQVKIDNVKMIPEERIKKTERQNFKDGLMEKYKLAALHYRKLEYIDSMDTLMSKLSDEDLLFCFWDKSKAHMTKEELELSSSEWYIHFEQNKAAMLKRYSALKTNPKYDSCKIIFELSEKMRMQQVKKEKQRATADLLARDVLSSIDILNGQNNETKEQTNVTTNVSSGTASVSPTPVVKSLTIPSLGIYNCDQIMRLQNPVEIFAEYKDEKGKIIEPLFVYLIDSKVNGMILYDGYMQYSPYRFAFSPSSKNTLIAIDENQVTYVISSEQFENTQSKNKQAKHIFIAKRIDKVKNKKELKEVL